MEKDFENDSKALGAGKSLQPPTIQEVRKMLKTDLQICLHLLESVYKDQATCDALADYLHGRFMNHWHKKELDAQREVFSSNGVN